MRELIRLSEELRRLDVNPISSMQFWESVKRDTSVFAILHGITLEQTRAGYESAEQLYYRFDALISRLNQDFWTQTWPVHDCHFHKSFAEFVNCPFTCLTELADCVEKIAMGRAC